MHITSGDGRVLGATHTPGSTDRWVVIAGATAVPHTYYRALADALAERCGVHVLSFDYRGIASSRDRPLAEDDARYADWAADLAAAIRYASDRGPTVVVGHSFGGHAFGMSDAHHLTQGLYTFATGAGWSGWMPRLEGLRVRFLWNVIGPILLRWYGYMPFDRIGMGESLPRGVFVDWKHWCTFPDYFFGDPSQPYTAAFRGVTAPVVGVNATDDDWAMPASAHAFLSNYPNHRLVSVDPSSIGRSSIGHMAYVRPSCSQLWEPLFEWVNARLPSQLDATG